MDNSKPDSETPRWWIAKLLLAIAAGAIIYGRFIREGSHQDKNIRTMIIVVLLAALLFLWSLLASGFRWKTRGLILLSVAAVGGTLFGLFHVKGFSGDLWPIFEPRWTKTVIVAAPKPEAKTNSVVPPPAFDYPQFGGPERNGVVPALPLATNWTANPPKELWRHAVGAGWSGFATRGNLAITQEQRGDQECVVGYQLRTGIEVWNHHDTERHYSTLGGEGPRATPTISGDSVYTLGGNGILNCLKVETGAVRWSHPILLETKSGNASWGLSSSPLVFSNLVVVSVGAQPEQSVIAHRADTGERAWAGGNESVGYSSPVLATLAGVPQILVFNNNAAAAHSPADGQVLWRFPRTSNHPHAANPLLVSSNLVLFSSGYGYGSELYEISKEQDKLKARLVYKTNRLKSKFANLILKDGHIYGLDDGIMVCLTAATGDLKWKEGRYGHGQLILCGNYLIVMAESGDVILVDPQPDALHEVTRFSALKGKTWNPPALAGDILIVRTDVEAAAFQLPLVGK